MANPPFKGTVNKNNINPKLTTKLKTNKTELLFLCQFIRSLQLGGRCASVVPDGVLTNNNPNAYKDLRKMIVENQRLEAVISMPSGVFKPYAGVSTAILIFTRVDAQEAGTDRVWFYDMEADGFSLDDKRTPIGTNDIPDIITRFHNIEGETNNSRKDKSFLVPYSEIKDKDYDLSIKAYKQVDRVKKEYRTSNVILDSIEKSEKDFIKGVNDLKNLLK